MDLETRLKDYIIEKKTEAVEDLAMAEGVDAEALGRYMSEYDYLGREKTEIIQDAVREKKMGLLARSATVRRIVEKMREIFDQYNWE
jgi:type I restriction enzyme R subunit